LTVLNLERTTVSPLLFLVLEYITSPTTTVHQAFPTTPTRKMTQQINIVIEIMASTLRDKSGKKIKKIN